MTLHIVVSGYGGHAVHHIENLGEHFEVVGIWDPDPAIAATIPDDLRKDSLEDLLSSSADALMICSPDEFHLAQIQLALAAGKHIFCEKPLLTPNESIEQLQEVFALAEQQNLAITSCHPRRYDKPVMWLKKKLPDFIGRFGKVISFAFDFSYHQPENEWKHSRSLLLDHVNHEVDLMNALFGICGFAALKLHDASDHYAVAGKRDDGITFNFQGTRRLRVKNYPEWCEIRFERGKVVLDMMKGYAFVSDHEEKTIKTIRNLQIDYKGRLQGVMDDFAQQIRYPIEGYLSKSEMIMNTESGIVLQRDGVQRIDIRE